jgi:hypothetical protein
MHYSPSIRKLTVVQVYFKERNFQFGYNLCAGWKQLNAKIMVSLTISKTKFHIERMVAVERINQQFEKLKLYNWSHMKEMIGLVFMLISLSGWPLFSLLFWIQGHAVLGPVSLLCSLIAFYVLYLGLKK